MSEPTRLPGENSAETPRELLELSQCIANLPVEHQQSLEIAYQRVADSFKRRQRILSMVQDALSQLRLDVKYLIFDLDMTRAERDELKTQLEEDF